jgi:hypothetical protein
MDRPNQEPSDKKESDYGGCVHRVPSLACLDGAVCGELHRFPDVQSCRAKPLKRDDAGTPTQDESCEGVRDQGKLTFLGLPVPYPVTHVAL